jgi:uncharacterized DUF497 family protein
MQDFHKMLNLQDYDFCIIMGTSGIEFHPDKDVKNIEKHGYSLREAKDIFDSWITLQTHWHSSDPYIRNNEIRQNHLASYKGKIVHITTTMRDGESIRIISMRPAKAKERKIYEDSKYISFYTKA